MTPKGDRLERDIADWLRREAPPAAPSHLASQMLDRTAGQRQAPRWPLWPKISPIRLAPAAATVAALFVVGLVVLALLASRSNGPVGQPSGSPVSQPSTPPPTSTPSPVATPFRVAATFPGLGVFAVLAEGSIWAPNSDLGTVQRIDAASDEVLATIPVGERPHAMAARGSEIWVSARDAEGWAVMRIDPNSNTVVDRIGVGDQGWAMTIVGDTMWMTSFESSRLRRIDLVAHEVVADIRLPNALGVAADEETVWVALGGQGNLARVDTSDNSHTLVSTGTQTTTMPLLVDDELWLTTLSSRQVVVISRGSAEVLDRIQLQFPMGLAYQNGLVWVTDDSTDDVSRDARVVALDVVTGEIVHVLPFPGTALDRSIIVDGEILWIAGDGLMRVDLSELGGI